MDNAVWSIAHARDPWCKLHDFRRSRSVTRLSRGLIRSFPPTWIPSASRELAMIYDLNPREPRPRGRRYVRWWMTMPYRWSGIPVFVKSRVPQCNVRVCVRTRARPRPHARRIMEVTMENTTCGRLNGMFCSSVYVQIENFSITPFYRFS